MKQIPTVTDPPLVVDLDGTLTRSDLLYESVCALLRRNLLYGFCLPWWSLRGKSYLKQQLADRVEVRADLLPYNESLVAYLQEQKARGRRVVLATGSNIKFARAVAGHLDMFSDVIASDAKRNMSGENKLAGIQFLCGNNYFVYAGNARVDLPVWRQCAGAVLVNPHRGVQKAAGEIAKIERIFKDKEDRAKPLLAAIRVHQWAKNLLLFVPLIMAHKAGSPQLLLQVFLSFVSFSLCASSVYLLNDLLDLPSDRQHWSKRKRPFAAGTMPIKRGFVWIVVLLVAGFGLAALLPRPFLWVLILYYFSTMAYSLWLKRAALVDVLTLAGLYTLRLVAGAEAASVRISFWLLAFCGFLFLSLALIKRYSELLMMLDAGQVRMAGRAYRAVDAEALAQFGVSSGYLSVLVLALYINSDAVRGLYSQPQALWGLCPMVLYWVSRLWLLARRNQMHEDPVVFTVTDWTTYVLAVTAIMALWVAT